MVIQTATMNEIVLTHAFDAPRSLVWRAWTEPELFKKWWGPENFTAPYCSIDLRVGGKYLSSMRGPDGREYWSTGVYREIVPQQKLAMSDSFADKDGNVVPATYYGMSADFPRELQITVTFADEAGKTKMTLRHAGMPAGDASSQASAGWSQSFDKLDAYLASLRQEKK